MRDTCGQEEVGISTARRILLPRSVNQITVCWHTDYTDVTINGVHCGVWEAEESEGLSLWSNFKMPAPAASSSLAPWLANDADVLDVSA